MTKFATSTRSWPNYTEVGKYLAVMMTTEEIRAENLEDVIPVRVKKSRRKLTTNCLFSTKPECEEWMMGRPPNEDEKVRMIANVLSQGVKMVMSHHTYAVGDDIFLQEEGCPIGLDLSQAVARATMLLYDELFLSKAKENGLKIHMYARYVDDSNIVVEKEGSETDTVMKLKDIANEILDGIIMEEDLPSKHGNEKLPILDMSCWINSDGPVSYTHLTLPTKRIV